MKHRKFKWCECERKLLEYMLDAEYDTGQIVVNIRALSPWRSEKSIHNVIHRVRHDKHIKWYPDTAHDEYRQEFRVGRQMNILDQLSEMDNGAQHIETQSIPDNAPSVVTATVIMVTGRPHDVDSIISKYQNQ